MLEPDPPTPLAPHKVYRPRVAVALARVCVALACAGLTLLALRAVAAPGGGSVIGGKLEYWRAHADEYDTVFLGSSHVFRAFVPAEYERATSRFGQASHAFNFGIQAVNLIEQRHLLREVLESGPRLERVLFEYQWLTPQVDPENAFSPRMVYWHDAESTRIAVERALHWGEELGPELSFVEGETESRSVFTLVERAFSPGQRAAEQHVQHFLTRALMIGRGKDVLRGLLGREHGQTGRYRVQHGYLSLEEDERLLASQGDERNSYRARRERFLALRQEYLRAVDTLDAAEVSFGDGEWMDGRLARIDDFELIASIAADVRARGIQFVLVILPSLSANRPFEERLMEELGSPVLRYNLPERYPVLYDPDMRWDSGHLSAEGARYFTALVARDVVALRGAGLSGDREVAQ